MRKATLVARILLGLVFTVFGINYFVPFLPPPEMGGAGGAFFGALAATGYMLPLLKATEIVSGVMLLSGFYVPLALTLIAPVIVNIAAFHLFLEPGGMVMGLVLVVLEIFLAWSYRSSFSGVLTRSARPE